MNSTIEFYEDNAERFIADTINIDMTDFYQEFEHYLKRGDSILDLGCGSGRDSKYFLKRGYNVIAVDPSESMCNATREYAGVETVNCEAFELKWKEYFEGIWACASLLHVPQENMHNTISKVVESLKPNGIMYISMKKGAHQRISEGRLFSDYTTDTIAELVKSIKTVEIVKIWESEDLRNNGTAWTNVLLRRKGY